MWGHKKCNGCGELGHEKDMFYFDVLINHNVRRIYKYYHRKCLIEQGFIECPCGHGWIPNDKKSKTKTR